MPVGSNPFGLGSVFKVKTTWGDGIEVAEPETATPALSWQDCQVGFQCSTAKVPLDYDQPSGTKIDLALIRLPATDPAKRIGSLFVNFGGPGASGVDRLRARGKWEWLFSPELRARFDVVSWHLRGIGPFRDGPLLRQRRGAAGVPQRHSGVSERRGGGACLLRLVPRVRASL